MFDDQPEICAPPGAEWTELDPELLQSHQGDEWKNLVGRFERYPPEPSGEMTNALRDGVRRRSLHMKTRAIHNDELLGFYSVKKVMLQISNRSGALLSVAEALRLRSPKPGLLLSAIVRSK